MTDADHPLYVLPKAMADVDWTLPASVTDRPRSETLFDVGAVFWERAIEAREARDEPLGQAYDILGGICRMTLDPEKDELPLGGNPEDPLVPSFWPEQIPEGTVGEIEKALDSVGDVWLHARLSDVVHATRDRDHEAAERAAVSLSRAASASWGQERERGAVRLLHRALQLTRPYGPTSRAWAAADAGVAALLEHAGAEDAEPADVNELARLGLSYKVGAPEALAALCTRSAERAEARAYWIVARCAWALAADAWREAKDEDRAQEARVRCAATHETEADRTLGGTSDMRNTQAAPALAKAVLAYRQAGRKDEADRVHLKLLEVQQAGAAEMAVWDRATRHEPAVSEMFTVGRDAVRGRPLDEALFGVAGLLPYPSREAAMADAQREVETYLFTQFLEDRFQNHDGKTTARGRTLEDRAMKNEAFKQRLLGAGMLRGARVQLYEEHALTYTTMVVTLMLSPTGRSTWRPASTCGGWC